MSINFKRAGLVISCIALFIAGCNSGGDKKATSESATEVATGPKTDTVIIEQMTMIHRYLN